MGGFLLLPLGTAGDVLPFCALGRALAARGHDVRVAANPCFTQLIAEAGLAFEPLGDAEEYRRLVDSSLFMSGTFGFGHLMRWASAQLDRTYQIAAAHRASTVLAHPLALGARLAEQRHGVRTATVLLSPALLESAPFSWLMRRLGDSHRWLALFPEWFAPRTPRWPKNLIYSGFPLYDGDGPSLSAHGEIVFTAGTGNLRARRFFRAAVEAAGILGRKALLLTRHREQLPPLGHMARHLDYAPLGRLLPGAAALVHHGGIGTAAAGLAAGVPQLVTPFAHDQPDNAARLEALEVARRLGRLRGRQMATALAELLDSQSVSEACRRNADRIATAQPFAAAVLSLESQEAAA
jgi:rhamnosyltransferase subunit B